MRWSNSQRIANSDQSKSNMIDCIFCKCVMRNDQRIPISPSVPKAWRRLVLSNQYRIGFHTLLRRIDRGNKSKDVLRAFFFEERNFFLRIQQHYIVNFHTVFRTDFIIECARPGKLVRHLHLQISRASQSYWGRDASFHCHRE